MMSGDEMSDSSIGKKWYAMQLRPRFEKIVALHLRHKGYEEYLPMYRSRRQWSDRVKEIDLPLFPGYIFCKFDATDRLPILVIPGVKSVVSFGGAPVTVEEHEISAIQTVINSGLTCGPWPYLSSGMRVRVRYGPLRGLEGFVVEVKNTYQLIISVTLLSRAVSVTIERDSIVPISDNRVKTTQERAMESAC
jgi:transcription antitermination factor NusG